MSPSFSAPKTGVPAICLITLGCAKNQVDSEKLGAALVDAGYRFSDSIEIADVVMVNTCDFIEDARRESVDVILEALRAKRDDAKTVVIGCMAQRHGREVVEALPEVDAVVGLESYGSLVNVLDRLTGFVSEREGTEDRGVRSLEILNGTVRSAPKSPYAYVKAAEGCDKPCSFCAIPLIRGRQRSRRPIEVREEAAGLVEMGAREIVLVAQDLAGYGRDGDRSWNIIDLLRFVSQIDELELLRLLYLYPKEIRPSLIEEMVTNPKIASYFDLSLQHASAVLLRAMKRPGDGDRYLDLVESIRELDPSAALRSSFIVGFPGETDAHVDELAEFLEIARLDWAGFFVFSPEEGTQAASLERRVPSEEALERLRHLQGIQDQITSEKNFETVGSSCRVVVDRVEDGRPIGRSYRQAPEIDGVIHLDKGEPGDWLDVEIVEAFESDLVAEVKP